MLAQGLATARDSSLDDWQVYADQLIAAKRPADAVPWYERVTRADPALPWAAWLQYGGALDQAGRKDEADVALAKAVELGPDQPLALNYLGYARIEQGRDVPGSLVLLEKASKLAPDDASITDRSAGPITRPGRPSAACRWSSARPWPSPPIARSTTIWAISTGRWGDATRHAMPGARRH
ncbi:hypothetical protein GCM10020258_44940 [Sphingomonas yabuuchiae]